MSLRQKQYTRIKALAESRSIEQEIADEKLEAREAAKASQLARSKAVNTAEAGVTAAEAKVNRYKAGLANAHAHVKVASAALAQATARESYTHLHAPFDGIITTRTFDDGAFIRDAASGGTFPPVLAVARIDLMRVVVWVPDDQVPLVREGREATLEIPSLPGHPFKGKVARTALSENYNTRAMRTEVDLPNPTGVLTDGMYGSLTLDLGKTDHGLTIPSTCLVGEQKNDERGVYVIRDGKAHRQTVRIGLDDGIHAEIVSGLQADAHVVEQHGPGLGDGELVAVIANDG